jgi:hypothetical protein
MTLVGLKILAPALRGLGSFLAVAALLTGQARGAPGTQPQQLPAPKTIPRLPALPRPPELCDLPAYLPRYDIDIDLDVPGHKAHVLLRATWTNPDATPTQKLVFNAHSRYVVPPDQVGFMAKMLEILRMQPSETLGVHEPCLELHTVTLACELGCDRKPGLPLKFDYEGDTKTALVVPLPHPVGPHQSVTVVLDITMRLPPKQGRWGQWECVSFLSNWLPVFAVYGPVAPKGDYPPGPPGKPPVFKGTGDGPLPAPATWQPTPFCPWHQPFFNEAGNHHVRLILPADHEVACTGTIVGRTPLADGRHAVEIEALGVRDFALLCSARYQVFHGEAKVAPDRPPVRVRVVALPEHEHYAREMVRYSIDALEAYSRWFGPYPWPDFTVAEAFFGWNGNECATLVMIDERVFSMPHLGGGYVQYLLSHEICHQWWYNLVGTNGYCETWMDEAMANYFSHRLLNKTIGKNNALMKYPRLLEWAPNIYREDYRSAGMYSTFGKGENGPCVRDMPQFGHLVNLFNLCYDKGGRLVGMIEDRLGEPAFMDFIRVVVRRYRYRILRVADFRRELEIYTGHSWYEFFRDWLYGWGLSDWSVEKVHVRKNAGRGADFGHSRLYSRLAGLPPAPFAGPLSYHVSVWLRQKAEYNEQTVLGFALPGCEGYPVRVPINPAGRHYEIDSPPATVEVLSNDGGAVVRVEVDLPQEPTQVAVDPDQVLVDCNPANNFWKPPVRWRLTPLYTFLEETDLTSAYDRWNVILGPWMYASAYDEAWYTRSDMFGVRAGLYRTQVFNGGAYAAYRTDFRDVVAGVDGVADHWPGPRWQTGFNAEKRLVETEHGDNNAVRGVVWSRYIFQYGSSLYLPPMHYLEGFAAYQDNFLPFVTEPSPQGVRYDRTGTVGLHYRQDYFVPYWDPEGGFRLDLQYEGGVAELPALVGMNKIAGQFSYVKYLPNLSRSVADVPVLSAASPLLEWLGDTRIAVRAFGATAVPTRGYFFPLGGATLFRGFDLAERQGSTVWVGSAEWRVPLAKGLHLDACDHIMTLRNIYGAVFYDVGNAYTSGHAAGPTAQAVGGGLRLDVTWFGFVERTVLRLDVARSVNSDAAVQLWFGINQPF